ncbi:TRAP transporter large permease subunit [Microbacterium sp. NPDC077644]|uniref:TRAP transporter large permease subunit n=1 Tax=Microbacterium sp. NPDC077644 TaxID=3155055 RepID=UPI00344CC798
MTLLLLALAIAILLAIRVPVPFAFLGPSLVYMAIEGQSLGMALRTVTNAASSFPLLAVPLFIFLGALANHAGIADRLFRFAQALLANVRGNLGYVAVGTSVGFAWMSGSAVADENIHHGEFIKRLDGLRTLNQPAVDVLETVLERGRSEGSLRTDVDALDVHLLISSYCFFQVANQHTFGYLFDRDLLAPERREHLRSMIGDVVVAWMTATP